MKLKTLYFSHYCSHLVVWEHWTQPAMNIHLLPHKTANHNILATELLVEHEEAPPMMHLGLGLLEIWGPLCNPLKRDSTQHGVLGRDGGANGYPTACPQEVNPLQGTVMSIPRQCQLCCMSGHTFGLDISPGKPAMLLARSLSRLCFGRSARRTFVNALRGLCSDD